MKTQNEFTLARPGILAKLAASITFVAISSLFFSLIFYLPGLHLAQGQVGLLIAWLLGIFLVGGLIWRAIATACHRCRSSLLLAIYCSALLFMAVPFVKSFPYLLLVLTALAFCLGPIIPLLNDAAGEVSARPTYLRATLWPWRTIGWGLAVLALAWLGAQFGLPTIFFSAAGLMYLVLLVVDRGIRRDHRVS